MQSGLTDALALRSREAQQRLAGFHIAVVPVGPVTIEFIRSVGREAGSAAMTNASRIHPEQVRLQLSRILASKTFSQSERASRLLSFVVTTTLEGRPGEIKESVIATEALSRNASFDPKTDPIVRVEAGRLRSRLLAYYESEGSQDPIMITLPKGGYVPVFAENTRPAQSTPRRNPPILFFAGLLAGLMLASAVWMLLGRSSPVENHLRLSILPPANSIIQSTQLSPDGRMIALVVRQQNRTAIWVRALDSAEARLIPGTERASLPFWSPDSRSLAYFSTNSLRRVELAGGPPQDICAASIPLGGGSWSRNGVIVFLPRPEGVLFQVPAKGGTPRPVTRLDESRGEFLHRSPEFFPDGRHFLYLASSRKMGSTTLRLGSLDSMDSKILLEGCGNAVYSPPDSGHPGNLLFYFRGALMAQPFDAGRMMLTGDRTIIASQVYYENARADFSVSSNRILAFRPSSRNNLQLGWFDRAGKLIRNIGSRNSYLSIRLSPDENRLVFGDEEEHGWNTPIWTMELSREQATRVSDVQQTCFLPLWSHDGTEILYSCGTEQGMRLVRQSLNGTAGRTLLNTPGPKFLTDWSEDRRFIAYFTPWPDFHRLKVIIIDLRKPEIPNPVPAFSTETPYNEAEAVFSPVSTPTGPRWVAYTSTETGRTEVYVRSFPGGDQKWPISNGGAYQPLWRRDGRELFFIAQNGDLMEAETDPGPPFHAGTPRPLFHTTIPPYTGAPYFPVYCYAVSRDGQRFLVNQTIDDDFKGSISILTHWSSALH